MVSPTAIDFALANPPYTLVESSKSAKLLIELPFKILIRFPTAIDEPERSAFDTPKELLLRLTRLPLY